MGAKEPVRKYTADELKDKARLAAAVPKLVEIMRNAPPKENGEMNLSAVRDQAYQHVLEQTGDIKDAKKLADSVRFLAMLRRDFAEDFEKLVVQEQQPKPEVRLVKPENKFSEIRFEITDLPIDIITNDRWVGRQPHRKTFLQFSDYYDYDWSVSHLVNERASREGGEKFCLHILNSLIETGDYRENLCVMNVLIQLLEEKFGLKVKVCGNCKYFYFRISGDYYYDGNCHQEITHEPLGVPKKVFNFNRCEHWTPKETSEKPSSA